jgi:predicted regulator of Ras-like GTPase activity (Roadblock/LC7/MglB family)
MAEGSASGREGLERVIADLQALSEEIAAAAVLSEGGELMASTLPSGVDQERCAAMLAALADLAGRTARENGASKFAQAKIREEAGSVLLVGLEGGATLAATTGPDARVGLVLYDMRNARGELEQVLGSGEGRRL